MRVLKWIKTAIFLSIPCYILNELLPNTSYHLKNTNNLPFLDPNLEAEIIALEIDEAKNSLKLITSGFTDIILNNPNIDAISILENLEKKIKDPGNKAKDDSYIKISYKKGS